MMRLVFHRVNPDDARVMIPVAISRVLKVNFNLELVELEEELLDEYFYPHDLLFCISNRPLSVKELKQALKAYGES